MSTGGVTQGYTLRWHPLVASCFAPQQLWSRELPATIGLHLADSCRSAIDLIVAVYIAYGTIRNLPKARQTPKLHHRRGRRDGHKLSVNAVPGFAPCCRRGSLSPQNNLLKRSPSSTAKSTITFRTDLFLRVTSCTMSSASMDETQIVPMSEAHKIAQSLSTAGVAVNAVGERWGTLPTDRPVHRTLRRRCGRSQPSRCSS